MTWATIVQLLTGHAIRCLAMAAHRIGRRPQLTQTLCGWALVGVLLGTPALVLQSAWGSPPSPAFLSTVARAAMRPLWVITFGSGASPVRSLSGGHQVVPPCDTLGLDDCDLEDDDFPAMAVRTLGALGLPSPSARLGVAGATQALPWPFRYLARPQLLTRL